MGSSSRCRIISDPGAWIGDSQRESRLERGNVDQSERSRSFPDPTLTVANIYVEF